MKKKSSILLAALVILALFVPMFFANQASAASLKKYTVGSYKFAAPANIKAQSQTTLGQEQVIFTIDDNNGFVAQCTPMNGASLNTKQIKAILKVTSKSMFPDMFSNCKFSTVKTGLGSTVKMTATLKISGVSSKCTMYGVCAGGDMFLGISVGNASAIEKTVLKTISLK